MTTPPPTAAGAIYLAEFKEGLVRSRRSEIPFTQAWRVTYRIREEIAVVGGFSSTFDLARKAVALQEKSIGPARKQSISQLLSIEVVDARPDDHGL